MPIPAILGATLGLQAATGLLQIGKSFGQDADAERLRSMKRPEYNIEPEYYDNVDIASYLSQSGLTQEAKDFYDTQAQRGLGRSVDAALQTGGGMNSFADLYDRFLQGESQIAAQDSQIQTQNIARLIDQNTALAGQKTMKWSIDEYEPYKDAQKAAAAAEDASSKNLFGGLNTIVGAGASLSTALSQDKLANPTIGATRGNTNTLVAPPNYAQTRVDVASGVPIQTQDTAVRLETPGVASPSLYQAPQPVQTADTNPADFWINNALKKLQNSRSLSSNFSRVA